MSHLARLRDQGLRLTAAGDTLLVEPKAALTDELRALIRARKAELLRELCHEETTREQRRSKAAQMLQEIPTRRHAFVVDEGNVDPVFVMVAVRTAAGIVTGELTIEKAKWDRALFLKYLEEMDRSALS